MKKNVWELVSRPNGKHIIGTKWVFMYKLDKNGIIVQNKEKSVARGYNQEKGLEFDETFVPVARLEAIQLWLAYAFSLNFQLYQIDVKGAFLNGYINEEVSIN